jgi:hypothetical protein
MLALIQRAQSSSSEPPISPIITTASVPASSLNSFITSMCFMPFTGSPPMPPPSDWPDAELGELARPPRR